jgi:hypothetical protein
MLSHRYGARFLLEEIPKEEFELILDGNRFLLEQSKHEFDRMLNETRFMLEEKPGQKLDVCTFLKKNQEKAEMVYEFDDNDVDTKHYKILTDDEIVRKNVVFYF